MTLSIDDIASSNIIDTSHNRRKAFNAIAGWNGSTYTKPIKYYIHDNNGYVNFERLHSNNNYAYAISNDEEKFIDDTFKQIDKYIDLNFERVYSATEATIDIYRTVTREGRWGWCSWSWWWGPYDYEVELEWTPIWESNTKLTDYPTLSSSVAFYIMHEIGHAIGLEHDESRGTLNPNDNRYNINDTLMSYNYSSYLTNSVSFSDLDISALKEIWGENFAPTNWIISSTSFNENITAGSTIATLSGVDQDPNDTHTFKFISSSTYGPDNNSFTIDGNKLKINLSPNYELKSSYRIQFEAIDSSGATSGPKYIDLAVNNLLEFSSPTDISLSTSNFNENIASNTSIATLSSTDPDSNDNHTYSLVSGSGDNDNNLFTISGTSLKIKISPDYESKSSYKIRVKSTDSEGNTYTKALTLSVNDINEAPTNYFVSSTSFDENISSGSTIAILSGVDEDLNDSHTFKFVSSTYYGPDNNSFTIDGNKLKINLSPDYELKNDYQIQFEAIDLSGLSTGPLWVKLYVNDLADTNIGTPSNDTITGGDGIDEIKALGGNDLISGGKGNDIIDGGNGSDTSIYWGNFSNYSFTRSTNSLQITDNRNTSGGFYSDGMDTLSNIEYIQFLDQTVEESKVDIVKTYSSKFSDYKFYNKGNGIYQIKTDSGYDDITGYPLLTFTGEATTSSFRDISAIVDIKETFDQVTGLNTDDAKMFRLYNASFKRLPDPDGLEYWIGKYSSRENDERAVASSFLVSDEFKERYGSNVSDTTYVNNLYQNVLGRLPDSSGLNYWLGQLNSGAETRYEVLLGFAESTENKAIFTEMTGFG